MARLISLRGNWREAVATGHRNVEAHDLGRGDWNLPERTAGADMPVDKAAPGLPREGAKQWSDAGVVAIAGFSEHIKGPEILLPEPPFGDR